MPENDLVKMQRLISEANRGRPLGRAAATDYMASQDAEGYSPPAPAPPKPPDESQPVTNRLLAQPLPQVSLGGPLKVQGVDLDRKVVLTSSGDIPLDADGAAVIMGIAVAAMQVHFNSVVEQAARAYGLWQDAPVSSGESTNALVRLHPAIPSVTSTGTDAGATGVGATRRKGRRGSSGSQGATRGKKPTS